MRLAAGSAEATRARLLELGASGAAEPRAARADDDGVEGLRVECLGHMFDQVDERARGRLDRAQFGALVRALSKNPFFVEV